MWHENNHFPMSEREGREREREEGRQREFESHFKVNNEVVLRKMTQYYSMCGITFPMCDSK